MPLLHPDIVVERRDYRKVGCGTKVRRSAAHIGSYVTFSAACCRSKIVAEKLKVTGPCAS